MPNHHIDPIREGYANLVNKTTGTKTIMSGGAINRRSLLSTFKSPSLSSFRTKTKPAASLQHSRLLSDEDEDDQYESDTGSTWSDSSGPYEESFDEASTTITTAARTKVVASPTQHAQAVAETLRHDMRQLQAWRQSLQQQATAQLEMAVAFHNASDTALQRYQQSLVLVYRTLGQAQERQCQVKMIQEQQQNLQKSFKKGIRKRSDNQHQQQVAMAWTLKQLDTIQQRHYASMEKIHQVMFPDLSDRGALILLKKHLSS